MVFSRRFWLHGVAALFALSVLAVSGQTTARADDAARDLVMTATERLVGLIRSDASRSEKETGFLQLMDDTAAVRAIAASSLGAPWRTMSDDQKERYVTAFRSYLARNYVARFSDYTGEEISYVKTTSRKKSIFVETTVQSPGAQPFNVEWRLREVGGTLKIVDIKAADLSLLATENEILNGILNSKGGDIEAFIATLNNTGS